MPIEENQPGIVLRDWNMYLLEKIARVSEEQIKTFRKKILLKYKKKFEKTSIDLKIALVALDSLTEKEIIDLSSLKEQRFFGVHDIKTKLSILNLWTGKKNPNGILS